MENLFHTLVVMVNLLEYYYNDEIPTEEDFLNSIGDYLTFEFNMISHDKGYLFEQRGDDENA